MDFQEWWEKEHGGKRANSAHMHIARSFAREAWQASRENMQEYGKYEFCRDTECQDLLNADTKHETCLIGDNYPVCCRTAKHFHKWLNENGYRIVKGE